MYLTRIDFSCIMGLPNKLGSIDPFKKDKILIY